MSFDETFEPDAPGVRRAEDALRSALSAHSSDAEFGPFEPADLRLAASIRDAGGAASVAGSGAAVGASEGGLDPPWGQPGMATSRRRWPQVLLASAAVVVVVIAVPLGLGNLLLSGGARPASMQASSAAAGAAGSEAAGGAATTAAAGAAPAAGARDESTVVPTLTSLPTASAPKSSSASGQSVTVPAGQRLVQVADVVVLVPESWQSGTALGSDWCTRARPAGRPAAPFVDETATGAAGPLAGSACGGVPEDLQSEHLEWRPAEPGEVAGTVTVNGWTYTSRIVGSVLLTYVHRPGTSPDVLGTARVVG